MARALLLHVLVTGALALLFCGLVTAQWLRGRLTDGPGPSAPAQGDRFEVTTAAH